MGKTKGNKQGKRVSEHDTGIFIEFPSERKMLIYEKEKAMTNIQKAFDEYYKNTGLFITRIYINTWYNEEIKDGKIVAVKVANLETEKE